MEEEGEFLQVAPPPKKGHVQPLPRGAGWGAREAGRGGGGPGGWAWGTNTIIYTYISFTAPVFTVNFDEAWISGGPTEHTQVIQIITLQHNILWLRLIHVSSIDWDWN